MFQSVGAWQMSTTNASKITLPKGECVTWTQTGQEKGGRGEGIPHKSGKMATIHTHTKGQERRSLLTAISGGERTPTRHDSQEGRRKQCARTRPPKTTILRMHLSAWSRTSGQDQQWTCYPFSLYRDGSLGGARPRETQLRSPARWRRVTQHEDIQLEMTHLKSPTTSEN